MKIGCRRSWKLWTIPATLSTERRRQYYTVRPTCGTMYSPSRFVTTWMAVTSNFRNHLCSETSFRFHQTLSGTDVVLLFHSSFHFSFSNFLIQSNECERKGQKSALLTLLLLGKYSKYLQKDSQRSKCRLSSSIEE